MRLFLLFLLPACCLAAWGFGGGSGDGKVLLKDVQTLTLHHGKMTTGRRSSPVPQLTCVGGSAAGKFAPAVVQCYNRGWDGQDVQVGVFMETTIVAPQLTLPPAAVGVQE
jgi:hypothetical protein